MKMTVTNDDILYKLQHTVTFMMNDSASSYVVFSFYSLYPRGASSARVIAIIMCLCVCVTRRYCIKMAKRRITQTTPRDSPGILVF